MTKHLISTQRIPSVYLRFALFPILIPAIAHADIYQWRWVDPQNESLGVMQSATLCNDGAGVSAVPSATLVSLDLENAYLIGANLAGANMGSSNFAQSYLSGANLTGANLSSADLFAATFTNANLTNAIFSSADLSLAELSGATFSGANFTNAKLWGADLYNSNLSGLNFSGADLHGAYLVNANLSNASLNSATFSEATLTGVNFSGADLGSVDLSGRDLQSTTFTAATLVSANLSSATLNNVNLHAANLNGVNLSGASATGADLSNATLKSANLATVNLSGANLNAATLDSASLAAATLTDAILRNSSMLGANCGAAVLTNADLSSANLGSINFIFAKLIGTKLTGANLTSALLNHGTLSGADFSGAMIGSAAFTSTTPGGFTAQQLYSTASYQQHNLRGVWLNLNNLTGWDFSYQDLTSSRLEASTLTNANFAGAIIAGAELGSFSNVPPSFEISANQLYSTASYQLRDLRGINLTNSDLSGWDFSGQGLVNATFNSATLTNANFSAADLRGTTGFTPAVNTKTTNTILPAGNIEGLNLGSGQNLQIRDFDGVPGASSSFTPIPITINSSMTMASGASLRISFHDANWGSTVSFASGIPVTLAGELDLNLDSSADIHALIGTANHIFNWNSPPDPGNHFDQVVTDSRFVWDISNLYSTGVVEIVHLYGDVNDNGYVDVSDLNDLAQHWQMGTDPGDPVPLWSDGDFNGDGIVNIDDLRLLADNWGVGVGSGVSTPSLGPLLTSLGLPDVPVSEPAALLAPCTLLILSRRRRTRSASSFYTPS